MRLLECSDDRESVIVTNFFGHDFVPPYAILSHTWEEGEEVTFENLRDGVGKGKKVYKKIRFCAEQAKRDGFRFIWVDTCCINKADHVELRKSINSMFHWYSKAEKCYVYLSDVSRDQQKASQHLSDNVWELAFRTSRWFTRGWTLQELLAPNTVEFFSLEWKRLGDRSSLKQWIHEITGISQSTLEVGASVFQCSVNERLSWIEDRKTKLEEDRAYAIVGILGVQLAPIYGEGSRNAFQRLLGEVKKHEKCVQDLHLTDPRDDKRRIEGTKGGLLAGAYSWIFLSSEFTQWRDGQQSRLLWIKGDPGKGKTMLLCGIADELSVVPARINLSYFFCQATDARINNARAVLRGLLYLLASQQPSIVSHVQQKHNSAGKSLFEDDNAWVALSEIFVNILQDPSLNNTYIIIDALDECIVGLEKLLDFIALQSSKYSRVRWIVSSRNWPDIEDRLVKAQQRTTLSLELKADSVSAAIGVFIEQRVNQLSQEKKYDNDTKGAVQQYLSSNADGTFLWVALVCQSLEKVAKRNVLKKLSAFPPGLDSIYEQLLQQMRSSDDVEVCTEILAMASTVYRPTTLPELITLVDKLEVVADEPESIHEIIQHCGFLTLRENSVYFVHQSAKDYLLSTASRSIFPTGQEQIHRKAFLTSVQGMSRTLHRNMYGLQEVAYLTELIEQPDPDPLQAVRYSITYSVDHLCDWNFVSCAEDPADSLILSSMGNFLRQKYLYWLEALSLCRDMPKGAISMGRLETILTVIPQPSL